MGGTPFYFKDEQGDLSYSRLSTWRRVKKGPSLYWKKKQPSIFEKAI